MRRTTAIVVALSLVGATGMTPIIFSSVANGAELAVPGQPDAAKKKAAAKAKPKKKQAYERSN
jgi:hypothetical protein